MKVIVLAGGTSTERDVSLISGSMIYNALKKRGHQAVLLDVYLGYSGNITDIFERDVDWSKDIAAIAEENPNLERIKAMRPDGRKNFFGPNVLELCREADAVFMALHGANGEDGKIQACFELMGIPYTGTDFVSSAMAMDKGVSKDIFAAHGIPTPAGFRLRQGERKSAVKGAPERKIDFPCIVKTCCGGSSVGVCIARAEAEYERALDEAFRYGDEVIVEQYIEGREFSVGVMDGQALPVIEIAPKQGFYDYKNKYQAGSTVETCPADLEPEKAAEMQRIAERVFAALRMKSYARMDFMMSREGEIYCLEANTLPGMTPTSLLPQEAQAVGMSFEDLCEKILNYAVQGEYLN